MDRGTADLTKNNAALAALVGQVEGLQGQQPPGGVCPQSCLDLGNYPMLHSSACVCAHQALGHMHDLALHARNLGAVATAGVFQGGPTHADILHNSTWPLPALSVGILDVREQLGWYTLALHCCQTSVQVREAGFAAGAIMVAVGLVWLLGHLAFWLGGMHVRQNIAQHNPSMEQLPLKSAPMAIARDDSDDSLILSEVEMAAAAALDHGLRAGGASLVSWQSHVHCVQP